MQNTVATIAPVNLLNSKVAHAILAIKIQRCATETMHNYALVGTNINTTRSFNEQHNRQKGRDNHVLSAKGKMVTLPEALSIHHVPTIEWGGKTERRLRMRR